MSVNPDDYASVNQCGGNFSDLINGSPNPPRLWSRFIPGVIDKTLFPQEELDMRRKAEVLQHKQNANTLSKKIAWSKLIQKQNPHSYRKTWATQSDTFTNPNTASLEQVNTTLICSSGEPYPKVNSSRASDVPGKETFLYYNKNIPLINYKIPRNYR
jgi:hypothetical protein